MSLASLDCLVDLKTLFPFTIDDEMRKRLCFSETLIISYFHDKPVVVDERMCKIQSNNENQSLLAEDKNETKEDTFEINDDEDADHKNFHFFFFNKQTDKYRPITEKDSLIMVGSLPKVNPYIKETCCLCGGDVKLTCHCKHNLQVIPESIYCGSNSLETKESCPSALHGAHSVAFRENENKPQAVDKTLSPVCSLTDAVRYGPCIKYSICFPDKTVCLTEIKNEVHRMSSGSENASSQISQKPSLKIGSESSINRKGSFEDQSNSDSEIILSFGDEHFTTTGGVTVIVEEIGVDGDKFLIHSSARYHKDESEAGHENVSIVDMNLHTIEENRKEYIRKDSLLSEDLCYLAICPEGYYCKSTKLQTDSNTSSSIFLNYDKARNFLLEGANIVLCRYLAITRYVGWIELTCVSLNGQISENIYQCCVKENVLVNSRIMTVFRVTRRIIDGEGYIKTCITTMSLSGNLIKQEWLDSKMVIHVNPLTDVDPDTHEIRRHIPLRSCWVDDILIFSKFLHMKDRRTVENEIYFEDNNELKCIMEDYLQMTLLLKPRDVISFTQSYFSSFSKNIDLPHNPFFNKEGNRVRYAYF